MESASTWFHKWGGERREYFSVWNENEFLFCKELTCLHFHLLVWKVFRKAIIIQGKSVKRNAFVFLCLIHRVTGGKNVSPYAGDSSEQGRRNTYLVICPSVSCDSPNRSDRVFHCFWHRHGEDGRAGQADGGILQHFEWDCNEASDRSDYLCLLFCSCGELYWLIFDCWTYLDFLHAPHFIIMC